ncbi:MAG: serine/threonine-protein phosphatase [Planctomycetia bacterium]|nr:serine/threonine-protein phosphatase [Planctomycetia bacterium]
MSQFDGLAGGGCPIHRTEIVRGRLARLLVGQGNTLQFHVRSHVGRKRSTNQDSATVVPAETIKAYRDHGWLLIVADGMGAHAGGEEASRLAVSTVPDFYSRHEPQQSPPRALRQSLEQANREIHAAGERDLAYKGMGTTCSALVILPQGALIGHIGDSRVYRVRGRTVEQLSRDHSLAWEIAAASGPDANGAPPGVPKNIITRSMGPHHEADIDLEGPFPIAPGDHFILCSDGLSGCLSDEEIALFAAELPTPDATAALVNLATAPGSFSWWRQSVCLVRCSFGGLRNKASVCFEQGCLLAPLLRSA